ncbi:MAG: TlpA disulfide reductase family protein [Aerococcaceae bacterium]|nr:TlpA disulfide reductase family protein [Aerococcaceae bacterium]
MKKIVGIILAMAALFLGATSFYQMNSTTTVKIEESIESVAVSSESLSASESSSSFSLRVANKLDENLSLAPSVTLEDSEGNRHDLSEFAGKPTIINLWASWCPPCREEMPYFEAAYQTYGDQINFVMLNALESRPTETKEVAQAFIEEIEMSAPVYYDVKFNNQIKFGATIMPTTVLLNDRGQIVKFIRGAVSQETLEAEIDSLLATQE